MESDVSELSDDIRERSKRDDAIIVGSEIRGAISDLESEIERLTAEVERLEAIENAAD